MGRRETPYKGTETDKTTLVPSFVYIFYLNITETEHYRLTILFNRQIIFDSQRIRSGGEKLQGGCRCADR